MKKGLVQSDGYLGILQLKRREHGGKVWGNVPDSQEACESSRQETNGTQDPGSILCSTS